MEGDVSVSPSKWLAGDQRIPGTQETRFGPIPWELESEGRELSPADWKPLDMKSSEPRVHRASWLTMRLQLGLG